MAQLRQEAHLETRRTDAVKLDYDPSRYQGWYNSTEKTPTIMYPLYQSICLMCKKFNPFERMVKKKNLYHHQPTERDVVLVFLDIFGNKHVNRIFTAFHIPSGNQT